MVNSQQEADEHNTRMEKIFERNNQAHLDQNRSQSDERSRTLSSDTAIQKKSSPKKYNSKQNKKVDVSVSESSFNDKRMASAKFSQSKIKEDPIQSTQKKAGFLSPKERMKARNA